MMAPERLADIRQQIETVVYHGPSSLPTGIARDFSNELLDEIDRLYAAIRKHRDYEGDDRCHEDDTELYQQLPEGYTPPKRAVGIEIEDCIRFKACRQNPTTEYVSPQRRIKELESELSRFLTLEAKLRDRLNQVEPLIAKGQGEWPGPGYVRDETWSRWQAEQSIISSLLLLLAIDANSRKGA